MGWATADHLRTPLIADALANAVATRDPAPGVVFHSDKGCQYTSAAFADLAADLDVTLSVGRTGQCWDNALAESFFASPKGECLDRQSWPTRASARRAVGTTSAGSTAPGCTARWATSPPTSTKQQRKHERTCQK